MDYLINVAWCKTSCTLSKLFLWLVCSAFIWEETSDQRSKTHCRRDISKVKCLADELKLSMVRQMQICKGISSQCRQHWKIQGCKYLVPASLHIDILLIRLTSPSWLSAMSESLLFDAEHTILSKPRNGPCSHGAISLLEDYVIIK